MISIGYADMSLVP